MNPLTLPFFPLTKQVSKFFFGKIRVSQSEAKTWSDFEPVVQTSGCQWLGLWNVFVVFLFF